MVTRYDVISSMQKMTPLARRMVKILLYAGHSSEDILDSVTAKSLNCVRTPEESNLLLYQIFIFAENLAIFANILGENLGPWRRR